MIQHVTFLMCNLSSPSSTAVMENNVDIFLVYICIGSTVVNNLPVKIDSQFIVFLRNVLACERDEERCFLRATAYVL